MNEVISTNHISASWIENLALEELNMDESGVINFNDHLSPAFLLKESSIKLMDGLRDKVEFLIDRFNDSRGNSQSGGQIKIFKISGTVNDFMLFRNSLRLIFARKSNDLITIGFLSSNGGLFSPRLPSESSPSNTPHEIKAHIGPFNDISWKFHGEDVKLDSLIRYYLSEFIRNSAR